MMTPMDCGWSILSRKKTVQLRSHGAERPDLAWSQIKLDRGTENGSEETPSDLNLDHMDMKREHPHISARVPK